MSKRVVSKANTPTRCGHGRLRTDCGFCARDDEIERLTNAIERHFQTLHSIVPWVAIIINDDGDLQTVDRVMEGDHIIIDHREAGQ